MPKLTVNLPQVVVDAIKETGRTPDSIIARAVIKTLDIRTQMPKLDPIQDKRKLRLHYSDEWWLDRAPRIKELHSKGANLYDIARDLEVAYYTVLRNVYKRGILE